ncbi:Response regulator receiver domain-containing protein [Robiginitalea myxolifaciens]|uniref:Response regulator receiver domain-containing protein n=1 Tax=Robiginitalea myxolifaciens TaxID=400055 RepID=A0A1I6FWB8_9FLAO|nr:response regulator [Robiginitalea myxolifaciens]SFR34097.1 Response regulator receiver domain-containing protein [Robiginitalea myxolifaciens]
MAVFQTACIIDDDQIYQFGMKILLREVDFSEEILIYQDGQEAIDALQERLSSGDTLPPVIFLDLNMPIKDGWEFLDDFVQIPQRDREQVNIYVISSSINPSDEDRARKYEVVSNYIVKPITSEKLLEIIAQHQ